MELKYYKCEICGKIVAIVKDAKVPTMCCGKPMTYMEPGTTDGAAEKHIPVVSADGGKIQVQIGEVEHPMLEEHFIEWISIETKEGNQIKQLHPGDKPQAEFVLSESDKLVAAFEHCNVHGLWKA